MTRETTDWRRVPGWVCVHPSGDVDHDWRVVSDWSGDPGVIGGTYDCSFKRCQQCGEEAPLEPGETAASMEADCHD